MCALVPSTRREGFLSSDCRSPFGLGPAEKESEVERTMSKNYESKAVLIEEIKTLVDTCQSAVLVDYRGLTVEEDTALRKKFREAGVTYKVLKNTYIKRAVD